MKKLMNLKGVKILDKNEPRMVSGENWGGNSCCTGHGSWCCITFPNGFEFCDAAQFYYNGNWPFTNGFRTTGYCCASCTSMGAPATSGEPALNSE